MQGRVVKVGAARGARYAGSRAPQRLVFGAVGRERGRRGGPTGEAGAVPAGNDGAATTART